MLDLAGRVAIVTGGASGIGRATALMLARQGAAICVADRNATQAEAVAQEIRVTGREAQAFAVDITDPEAVVAMVHFVETEMRGLDILVHSAGIGAELAFLETSIADWRRLIDVDLTGCFLCCQAAARVMQRGRQGGRIIALSSTAGLRGGTGRAAYGAAKGGVIALVKVMAVELAPFAITANAIAPGAIDTELVARMHDAETRRAYTAGIPLARYGIPDEVAATAVFLASDEARYISGETLVVDGGFVAAGVMKRR
ncbi:MAG: SDR family oxidoreductase [Cupriavidus sp.]|nr:SDR family oxidoreductase [Cupriavidus sp.]MCA3704376.1 SDR family oxidoreductase [Methylobacterium sp.]